MMCAYAEDRPFIDPHDLKNIRKDLLGEDDEPKAKLPESAQHNRNARPAPVSAQSGEGFGDLSKTLQRIASALESIDGRLAKMSPEGKSSQKDSVSSTDNIKPLTPFWKK
jgi:general secretion pathway protein A